MTSELDFYRRELARAKQAVESMRLKLDVTNGEARQATKAVEAMSVAKYEMDQAVGAKDLLIKEAENAIELLVDEQQAITDENGLLAEKLRSRSLEVRRLLDGKTKHVERLQVVQAQLHTARQRLQASESEARIEQLRFDALKRNFTEQAAEIDSLTEDLAEVEHLHHLEVNRRR